MGVRTELTNMSGGWVFLLGVVGFIVEVTRAANSFGRRHLPTLTQAFDLIADIVEKGQQSGQFRDTVAPRFAAMAFYGAIEQVLTGWIFGLLEDSDDSYDRAKDYVVGTIVDGLAP